MSSELKEAMEKSARGGFFLISGSTLAMIIMAVAAILVGKLLGPESYGDYNLTILVPQILLLFTDLGVNTGIIRFASSSRSTTNTNDHTLRVIRHGMMFRLIAGLLIFAVSLLLSGFLAATLINRPGLGLYVQIASLSILFQIVFTTATSTFVGLDKTEYNALATNIQAITKTVISVALVLLGFGIAGAVVGYAGGYIVAGIIAGLIFLRLAPKPRQNNSGTYRQTFKTLATYGLPLYISAVVTGFLPLFSQVILAFYVSSANVGNYRAAINFITLIAVIPLSITTALLPGFSRLDSSTSERVRFFFKRANKYTCLMIIPVTVLLMIFSRQIVQIVYGTAYGTAWLFLSLNCVVYFLVAIGYLGLSSLFNGLDDTRTTLKMTAMNISIFISLAPILTWTYDVPGVIISSLISNAVATLYGGYVARSKFHVEFDTKSSARIYAVAGISSIPSILLITTQSLSPPTLLVTGGLLFVFIYLTLVPLTKIITPNELQSANQVIQRIKPLSTLAKPLMEYEERILKLRFKNPFTIGSSDQ
jgi:O-antigen/teichoic acid export membrane protein